MNLVYVIEWSKSERKKQVSYINTYTWNLEKQYRWTYLQRMNRDIENKFVRITGAGEGGVKSKNSTEMDTGPRIKQRATGSCRTTQGARHTALWRPGGVTGGGAGGRLQSRRHTCTYSWFLLPYRRNQPDTAKQTESNWRAKRNQLEIFGNEATDQKKKKNQCPKYTIVELNIWKQITGSKHGRKT